MPPKRQRSVIESRKRLMTMHEFARACKVPEWRVQWATSEGLIRPRIEGGRGRGNASMFAADQIDEWARVVPPPKRMRIHDAEVKMYTGAEAKACFQRFSEGKTIRDCVLEFAIHPTTVQQIYIDYSILDESVVISATALRRIEEYGLDGPFPITKESDLVEVLRLAAEENKCEACKSKPRQVCKPCVAREVKRVRESSTVETKKALLQEQGAMESEAELKAQEEARAAEAAAKAAIEAAALAALSEDIPVPGLSSGAPAPVSGKKRGRPRKYPLPATELSEPSPEATDPVVDEGPRALGVDMPLEDSAMALGGRG